VLSASAARGGQAAQLAGTTSAPAGRPSRATGAGRLAGTVIVIDPGHNPGNNRYPSEINRLVPFGAGMKPCDTTGTATNDGYSEAAYTLDVSYRVVALLRAQGATVVLTHTRTSPAWGPCITERAAIGNRRHAAAAISIHADGGPASGRGFSTIIPSAPIPSVGLTSSMIAADLGLALDVRNAYLSATGMPYSSYLGSRGVYHSNAYGGTNLSHVPKIFIETGNMRNATDAAMLESAAFRQRAARGIANGIVRFVSRR
jgi:N-acetylmuramoyl-L-alanine amidase